MVCGCLAFGAVTGVAVFAAVAYAALWFLDLPDLLEEF